jgi:hypothetical protein
MVFANKQDIKGAMTAAEVGSFAKRLQTMSSDILSCFTDIDCTFADKYQGQTMDYITIMRVDRRGTPGGPELGRR